jgi:adenylate cyclase
MTSKVKRRLTTILCADAAGYSRLMEADEAGTLATLRRHRAAMAALIERHDGRIVNTWGDAIIAEFASVVEAVQCAVEMQQELAGENDPLPDAERMRFRIGINLGDVMVEDGDVYGEGVNIAARLQEIAEPGGVLISGPVYDQVHNKLSIGFDFLGRQRVKNVAVPVISYRVLAGETARPARESRPAPPRAPAAAPQAQAGPEGPLARIWHWYIGLPRRVAAFIAVSAFLALLNVFTGLQDLWFHWPVAALLLIGVLWSIIRSKPSRR